MGKYGLPALAASWLLAAAVMESWLCLAVAAFWVALDAIDAEAD